MNQLWVGVERNPECTAVFNSHSNTVWSCRMSGWRPRAGRSPVPLLTSASHTNSTWSAAGSLTSTTGWKWVHLMLDNRLHSAILALQVFIDQGGLTDGHYQLWVDLDKRQFVFRPTQQWSQLQRALTRTVLGKWTKSSSILLWLFCDLTGKEKEKTSLRNVAPQLAPQRSFHPGRIGAWVPGFHQVHEAEDRPRGSTHLGRLLTDPIHPSMAAVNVLIINPV